MKGTSKKSLIILEITILLILIAIIANIFTVKTTSNPFIQLGKLSYTNGSKPVNDVDKYNVNMNHDNKGTFYLSEATPYNKVGIPNVLYCIDHGTHFEKDAYYTCTENHKAIESYGAYIITQPNNILAPVEGRYSYGSTNSTFAKGENISSEMKQMAIWLSDLNQGQKPNLNSELKGNKTYIAMVENLLNEAKEYEAYEKILNENNDNFIKETSTEEVKVVSNSTDQNLKIGPYKIDYLNGKSDSVSFAGISKITVYGYNDEDCTKLIKELNIEGYIQNGEPSKELRLFNPTKEEGYVDRIKNLDGTNKKEELSYPESGKEFWLTISNPNKDITNSDEKVKYIKIEVEYKFMTASGQKCEMEGKHEYTYTVDVPDGTEDITDENGNVIGQKPKYKEEERTGTAVGDQKMMDAWGSRELHSASIMLKGKGDGNSSLPITMNLGGYVWEDVPAGKENLSNGLRDSIATEKDQDGDKALPNVKVTLYECPLKDGKLQYSNGEIVRNVADLLSEEDKKQLTEEQIKHRINPQLTDSNGYYQFDGLDASNKYYVAFEYNGQVYLPTDYLVYDKNGNETKQYESVSDMVNANVYNTDTWRVTSKGTEADSDRYGPNGNNGYDAKFAEIKSSPLNYETSNSLGLNEGTFTKQGQKLYNQTYSQYDLMGFVLNGEGKYEQTGVALIDGFYKINSDKNIEQTNTAQEGIISKKIQEFITNNKAYPNADELKEIYTKIVSEKAKTNEQKAELWRKLQFIEDCKMKAYTGSALGKNKGKADLYPVYNEFTISNTGTEITGDKNPQKPPIYDGQYFVNLGLWRRHEVDVGLRKDILYAATRINGETELYKYDKRKSITQEEQKKLDELKAKYLKDRTNIDAYNDYVKYKEEVENKAYWSIELRMQDYENYYKSGYNRELYPSDYNQRGIKTNGGSDLELYVTYKVTVRNSSESILNQITEVVDYYDKDYTYIDDLSWVMYKKESNDSDNKEISVTEDDYRNTIDKLEFQGNLSKYAKDIDSSYSTRENKFNGESIYGKASKSDMESKYNSVYVHGLDNKKLASGEEAYIYLTFKVNSDSEGPVVLDDENSLKENFAEINGYKTFYRDGTTLPNGVTKGSGDAAGLIDNNSNPGNLCLNDLKGDRYEKNFENDTDRAKSIQVKLYDDPGKGIRSINGVVWNDKRTTSVSDSVIGNGVRDLNNKGKDTEIGIKGVTVELVEKLANGKEYLWQTTDTGTGKGRKRNLKTGEWEDYTYSTDNKSKGYYEFSGTIPGDYIVRFHYGHNDETVLTATNGISYNGQDFKSTVYQKNVKTGKEISGYTETYYNIQKADDFDADGIRLSDAKDVWSRREEVNNYSNSKVTNHKAEVLSSPYTNPNNNDLIRELRGKTNMTAETAIIQIKGEYNRSNTDGDKSTSNGDKYYNNKENGSYTLNNLDLGLTERPKAQLELSKNITKLSVVLANGSELFDSTPATPDGIIWMGGKLYDLSSGDDKKYDDYYNDKDPYAYRDDVKDKVTGLYNNSNKSNGLISVSMDEELMHGASIKISYELAVKNVGEIDYTDKDFYYKATGASNKVTTAANVVLDYVANNLQFRQSDNPNWKVATNITDKEGNVAVNNGLTEAIKNYNTTITTENLASNLLKPGETVKTGLVLSQVITPQNAEDDRTYNNIAEIVSISNNAGRRMAYSIQGNQDPTDIPQEVDSAKSEKVLVGKPTGIGNIVVYIAVAIATLAIIIVGIIFIKKKVLKK